MEPMGRPLGAPFVREAMSRPRSGEMKLPGSPCTRIEALDRSDPWTSGYVNSRLLGVQLVGS